VNICGLNYVNIQQMTSVMKHDNNLIWINKMNKYVYDLVFHGHLN